MYRRSIALAGVLGLAVTTPNAFAAELDAINALGAGAQRDFRLLSEDLGAALSYKALSPAEPLGITGFDIGVEVTNTELENEVLFRRVGYNESSLPVPKLHVHKGLPFNFDVGVMYSAFDDYSLVGAELKYAILAGNTALPAIALRATYSKLGGLDQLDFETVGGELTVSKGFAMLTPYAGIGTVRATSTPQGIAAAPIATGGAGLREEKFNLDKYFVGINLNFGIVNFAIEGDKTGDATTYGGKFGLRF